MKIIVTGGCGYTGVLLVDALLELGHQVVVVDTQWFGNILGDHQSLTVLKQDIRDLDSLVFEGAETVFHLANIANDPSVDLDPVLSWEVNVLGAMHLAELAKRSQVKRFIYASSGSVYGVQDAERVTENLPLVPISVYNKTKMVAERVLLSYANTMDIFCVTNCVCNHTWLNTSNLKTQHEFRSGAEVVAFFLTFLNVASSR